MSKLCDDKLCVSKLCVDKLCVSKLCVDKLCVSKLCVCEQVVCQYALKSKNDMLPFHTQLLRVYSLHNFILAMREGRCHQVPHLPRKQPRRPPDPSAPTGQP